MLIRSLTDAPDLRFVPGAAFETDEDPARHVTVARVGPHNEGLIVLFAEVPGRDAAERLRGATITISRSERRALGSGEYWEDDLVGRHVVDPEGARLGSVVRVVFSPAQDRLVVSTDSGDVEVPFVDAIVTDVPDDGGPVVVDAPSGLF